MGHQCIALPWPVLTCVAVIAQRDEGPAPLFACSALLLVASDAMGRVFGGVTSEVAAPFGICN